MHSPKVYYKFKTRDIFILFAVVSFLIFISYVGYIFFNSHIYTDPIIKSVPEEIKTITIKRPPNRSLKGSLKYYEIEVTDVAIIQNICSSLNKSKKFYPNRPKTLWKSMVVLNMGDKAYDFKVVSTPNNGVLIRIHSNGDWGWHLGTFRSDSLGPIIEQLVGDKLQRLKY